MGDMFGGKLTGGIFAIVALIVGIIMIGILAGPFGSLISFFSPAAEDTEGNRFNRAYTRGRGHGRIRPSVRSTPIPTGQAGRAYALIGPGRRAFPTVGTFVQAVTVHQVSPRSVKA